MEEPDPSSTPPSGGSSGGASNFEKIGLPIILLCIIALIFFLVHAAITWLPEVEWWKKLTGNYKNVDDDKATFLQRRRGSLRRKLNRYKDDSKARGNDGRGGVSTGEVSKDDFDYVPRINKSENKDPETLSKAPSRSSIEENDQPLSVAKFYNRAFEDTEDSGDEVELRPAMREKKNKSLERYRHSAEFYSQFSLVPLGNSEVANASVESIDATVHSSAETLNTAPVAPRRKKFMSQENLSQEPKRYDAHVKRPMAVSMNDLRPSIANSMNDLHQREYDYQGHKSYSNKSLAKSVNDVRDGYGAANSMNDLHQREHDYQGHKSYSDKSLAKSVNDVQDGYGGSYLNVRRSTNDIANTYGGSNGYIANQKTDYTSANRNAAKSVDDVRKMNGYSNGYGGELAVHKNTARSADDLRSQRQYQGSLPSSASSSYQSLDENAQNGRPQSNRPSYAKSRTGRSSRRKMAPQPPRQMPGIPEHNGHSAAPYSQSTALYNHSAAPYNHSAPYSHTVATDQPAILPTSHSNHTYDTAAYRGPALFNQSSAKV